MTDVADIMTLTPPKVADSPSLQRVLRATALMREKVGGAVPIIGVVMSPLSLPVMQLGFGAYLELLYERRDLFDRLMRCNEDFCVEWANAQLQAGATAIGYFDPVSSPTILAHDLYASTGLAVARRTIPRIAGPAAMLMASGTTIPIIDQIATTGAAIIGASCDEDLAEVKRVCAGRLTVLGNLNGIEMRRWSAVQAEAAVKDALRCCASGGGFILSDTHGEIPWQVPGDVLSENLRGSAHLGPIPADLGRRHAGLVAGRPDGRRQADHPGAARPPRGPRAGRGDALAHGAGGGESAVADEVLQLFMQLFAPRGVAYMPVVDGEAGATVTRGQRAGTPGRTICGRSRMTPRG